MSTKKAKITVIGDGCTGKAYLLEAYIRGEFYERGYIPTVFDNYTKEKDIDGEPWGQFILVYCGGTRRLRHLTAFILSKYDVFLIMLRD
ncbi:Ras family [Popillia japonica]|uniref:Ras family n=1 Tax=Popillia japonica TaxID=7064 RepID=A0AAW1LZ54_POPJA